MHSEPVQVPVWISAYRYGDTLYRFLVNGQTGKVHGDVPTSWKKIAACIAIALLLVGLPVYLYHWRTIRRERG